MADERRYGPDEVEEIFSLAAREERGVAPGGRAPEGLTLAELQEIGAEVDLAPDRIAEAASALDARRGELPRRTQLGMPITAGRVVELPRAPTDGEWELLLGEIRRTFSARGELSSYGRLREWSNGNLHVAIEPTEDGTRLRMGTLKGSAAALNAMSAVGAVMGLVLFVTLALAGDLREAVVLATMLWGGAAATLAFNALSLPRWARERDAQMAYLAERATTLLSTPPPGDAARPEGGQARADARPDDAAPNQDVP